MNRERWQKIEEIFNKALITPVDERVLFIAQKSAGDVELINEINELVLEAERDDKFLADSIFTLCRRLVKTEMKAGSVFFAGNVSGSEPETT